MKGLSDRTMLGALLTAVFGSFTLSIFGAFVGIQMDSLGTQILLIGLVLAMRNVVQIVLRIPLGEFGQVVGRRPMLIAGVIFYTMALAVMYAAESWELVLVATICVAVGMSCFWPSLFAYIGDIAADDYGAINGRIFQGLDAGQICGTLFATLILDYTRYQLREVFGLAALIGVGGVCLLILALPEALALENRKHVSSKSGALVSSFRQMLVSLRRLSSHTKLKVIYIAQFIVAFTDYLLAAFFPLLVVVARGLPESDVSKIWLITCSSLFFVKPYLGRFVDKSGFRMPIVIGFSGASASLAGLAVVDGFWLLAAMNTIMSLCILLCYLAVNCATSSAAGSSQRGAALGVGGAYVAVGRSLSTLTLAPVWNSLSLEAVFIVGAIILAGSTMLLYVIGRIVDSKTTATINEEGTAWYCEDHFLGQGK